MSCPTSLDLKTVRQRLEQARGKDYWRTLEELAGAEGFQELLAREFPRQAGEWTDPVTRRHFLMLMGASLGLAGLSGCSPAPQERIMPYVRAPEEIVPGRPLYFATAMPLAGYGRGLLVQSHMGRPTKVEGNPDHPSSPRPTDQPPSRFGPTDRFAQASVLTLYDPDRSQAVVNSAQGISTWEAFEDALRAEVARLGSRGITGARVRILTGTITSPTLLWQIRKLTERFPAARWHVHEPAVGNNARLGAVYAFDEDVEPYYHFDQAEVVLALDSDFLACGPDQVRHTRDLVSRRRVRQGQPRTMSRLYVVESTPSSTGAYADHRLPLRASRIESFTRDLAVHLGVPRAQAGGAATHGAPAGWIEALAADLADLAAHHENSLVVAGDNQPPLVHALAHAINDHLGNIGRTVTFLSHGSSSDLAFGPSVEALTRNVEEHALPALARAMDNREVDILLILGCNPVYTAAADLNFAQRLERVPFRVHLGLYHDETAQLCHWHIPEAHYLESWQDVRASDGTASIIQPLIEPLYHGRTAHEVLSVLIDESERSSYEIVRGFWQEVHAGSGTAREVLGAVEDSGRPGAAAGDFEAWWRRALHAGLIAGTRRRSERTPGRPRQVQLQDWTSAPGGPAIAGNTLEIAFRPDPTIFDGQFANNGWLQELPKPLTKLTWDNVALISPATAVRLGFAPAGRPDLANEQVATLEYKGNHVDAPLWVLPGQPDDCVTVHLGYGRWRAGRVGNHLGFNAYRLRTSTAPWFDTGLSMRATGRRYPLSSTQSQHLIPQGREALLQHGTKDNYEQLAHPEGRDSHLEGHRPRQTLTLFPERAYTGYKWGMNIDLTACTGCGACMTACQAENNIPVVGKTEVGRGRAMHWIRVDTYYVGGRDNPEMFFQPVPCMHCENAPCELVCPVAATVHSEDGLNDMVYNRCVGTRYCSNNCPYKVRRFNFLAYSSFTPSSRDLQFNPEVTVRSRGVMEKCTYCVQRIRTAQIDAELENRRLRDGEVVTACQAACPAGVIVFGDLNLQSDGTPSKVAQLEAEPLHYGMLTELNTRPRTTYLAALKNPNPAIVRLEQRS
jgi:molybdopterin-containing oxidoreductase family iron-sulfur binding subunit